MKMHDESKGQLCILDFGLVTEIPADVRDIMVRATIHLANRDFSQLIEDFIDLDFLPPDVDRSKVYLYFRCPLEVMISFSILSELFLITPGVVYFRMCCNLL